MIFLGGSQTQQTSNALPLAPLLEEHPWLHGWNCSSDTAVGAGWESPPGLAELQDGLQPPKPTAHA